MSTTVVRETGRVGNSLDSPNAGVRWVRRWVRFPRSGIAVLVLALAAVAAWAPFVTKPLSSDEAGFLMVAAQWAPGTSLYGNYWVDRPPLLIGLFQIADLGGGAVALRLLGILAVVVSVLLASRIGRLAAPWAPSAPVATAATAAVFLSTPLFGTTEVDGELLAVPFVLAGLVAALAAVESAGRPAWWWWVISGALAVGAGAIKQSMLELFVGTAAAAGWLLWTRQPRRAMRALAGFGLGSLAAVASLLMWAASRGTEPGPLWDAVFSFRAEAASVIAASAPSSTDQRAEALALSFVVSGAGAVLLAAVLTSGRRAREHRAGHVAPAGRRIDVRVLAGAVLAWEIFAVAGGGSYWLHYLIGTVPGLVLVVAAAAGSRSRRMRWIAAALAYAAAVTAAAVVAVIIGIEGPDTDVQAEQYLAAHSAPGDTGVVAFGDPALLQAAHLSSPYPQLWSLPVRVRDPRLTEFTRVLTGPDRPTWVIVDGTSLTTWGVDAAAAQPVLDREYHLVHVVGDWHLYRLDSQAVHRSDHRRDHRLDRPASSRSDP